MVSSHADSHDLDKLNRWRQGLAEAGPSRFPVYAVFLVGLEDRGAHDVFREFRSSFEERDVPYENLVIFGQHGVSKTLQGLSTAFGTSQTDIPLLALFSNPNTREFHTLPLVEGNFSETGGGNLWRDVLSHIESASDAGVKTMGLESMTEITTRSLNEISLEAVLNSSSMRQP
ncbi:MAG: hypothetical protein BZY75_03170 [SAR202 cluster bacterium Io17-Chloro-G7]|nr:MAG: hypothetical protein BZY75_03170 [SAR202 cluster bacterium Io17-Chloro-G7]